MWERHVSKLSLNACSFYWYWESSSQGALEFRAVEFCLSATKINTKPPNTEPSSGWRPRQRFHSRVQAHQIIKEELNCIWFALPSPTKTNFDDAAAAAAAISPASASATCHLRRRHRRRAGAMCRLPQGSDGGSWDYGVQVPQFSLQIGPDVASGAHD